MKLVAILLKSFQNNVTLKRLLNNDYRINRFISPHFFNGNFKLISFVFLSQLDFYFEKLVAIRSFMLIVH